MDKKTQKHFDNILIYLFLKYGVNCKKHFAEAQEFWDGPLTDNNYFLSKETFKVYNTEKIKEKISRLKEIKFHPVYTRDFLEGIVDSACTSEENPKHIKRIYLTRSPELKAFLSSDIHGYNIHFDKKNNPYRTRAVPFLTIPCEGDLELYLAGALSASKPCFINGELMFSIKSNCIPNFKKMHIQYKHTEDPVRIVVSPFYIMLYMGLIPENIFFNFYNKISKCNIRKLKSGCLDALIHWKHMVGRKLWEKNDLPLLVNRDAYYKNFSLKMSEIDEVLLRENINYIDKRVIEKCERWYNINNLREE